MTATADFVSAERSCNEVGGHLVSICNAFENNFLAGACYVPFNNPPPFPLLIGLPLIHTRNFCKIRVF